MFKPIELNDMNLKVRMKQTILADMTAPTTIGIRFLCDRSVRAPRIAVPAIVATSYTVRRFAIS